MYDDGNGLHKKRKILEKANEWSQFTKAQMLFYLCFFGSFKTLQGLSYKPVIQITLHICRAEAALPVPQLWKGIEIFVSFRKY